MQVEFAPTWGLRSKVVILIWATIIRPRYRKYISSVVGGDGKKVLYFHCKLVSHQHIHRSFRCSIEFVTFEYIPNIQCTTMRTAQLFRSMGN